MSCEDGENARQEEGQEAGKRMAQAPARPVARRAARGEAWGPSSLDYRTPRSRVRRGHGARATIRPATQKYQRSTRQRGSMRGEPSLAWHVAELKDANLAKFVDDRVGSVVLDDQLHQLHLLRAPHVTHVCAPSLAAGPPSLVRSRRESQSRQRRQSIASDKS